MSFRNPILAGATLVREAIQSANFVPGSSGWQIQADGGAEFNGATFRGTVVVQGDEAILFYSGTPAAGNLILAIAPVAGVDAFGNSYNQGLTIGTSSGVEIVGGLTGGSPLLYGVTGNANILNSGALQATTQNTGNAEFDIWQLLGPQDKTQGDYTALQMISSSEDGTTASAHVVLIYVDPSGTAHPYLRVGSSGIVATGTLICQPSATSTTVLSANVGGNSTFDTFRLIGSGQIAIGSGSAARDVTFGRTAANILGLTSTHLACVTAGFGLQVKEGANAKQGTAVLVGGTVTVANTAVTANSRILLTSQVDGGTPGFVRVSTRVAGTSFTIKSSSTTDTSTIAYEIFEPA